MKWNSLLIAMILIGIWPVSAQTTTFNYQGKLTDSGGLAASYDFTVHLCATPIANCNTGDGSLAFQDLNAIVVSNDGSFNLPVSFGSTLFDGSSRYLRILMRRNGQVSYTELTPRQEITSSPYSIQSLKATNTLQLGGVAANQYVLTTDTRLNAVQNTTTQQPGVNFNIGGTGTANVFAAATQFNLGGSRILSNGGTHNLFLGLNSGAAITTGSNNAFFGKDSGRINHSGGNNSFFGTFAGYNNGAGSSNSFFGSDAGFNTQSGGSNSFFGSGAGFTNQSGNLNTFFGIGAGFNSTGSSNTFVGSNSGNTNTSGGNNTLLGANANVASANLSFATAIGAGAVVNVNNTLVIGRAADTVQLPGNLTQNGTTTSLTLANGFVATGAFGAGTIPVSGGGARMMFYPRKAAFRAGRVLSAWEDANIGDYSAAFGWETIANKIGSFAGGYSNIAAGDYSTVFGNNSRATGLSSVALGDSAKAENSHAVALGFGATAIGVSSFALGGSSNASGANSIALGNLASASATYAIAIGKEALASTEGAVAIGDGAEATGQFSFAGGQGSTAIGLESTALNGGFSSGRASLAIGGGTNALGDNAVAIGWNLMAGQNHSVALGKYATSFQEGAFVYGDGSTSIPGNPNGTHIVSATAPNQFVVRAAGGFRFRTKPDLTTGCDLPSNSGTFACTSSRFHKENFEVVSVREVLHRLRRIPVMEWNYRGEQKGVRHIGAFAEDFYREFRLGTDDKSIGLLDIAGVNTAAIKALDEEVELLRKTNAEQQKQIDQLKSVVCTLKPDAAACK